MSILKKQNVLRFFAILLIAVLMIGALSSCGKPTGTTNTSSPGATAQGSAGQSSSAHSDEPANNDTPLTESQLFTQGIKQVLLTAVNKSDTMTSAHLDLLLNPGMQLQQSEANFTKTTVNLINPEEDGESLTVAMESILDASSGDASTEISLQSGSEVAQSGGIYFVGDTMLLKSANVEKQMIQHTVDQTVAKSLQSLPALARYTHVLGNATDKKLGESDWSSRIDGFVETLLAQASEGDFVPAEETITLAGIDVDCTTSTLELAGVQAAAVTRDFVALLGQDASFQSYFVTLDEVGEDEYGITGLKGVLRDLQLLPQEALTMKFKLIQAEGPLGLRIYTATEETSFYMEFLFYENGYTRQNNIVFRGFDGSSVTMQDVNVSTGGDNYEGQVSYETMAPGKIPQENASIQMQGTINDNGAEMTAEMSYYSAAVDDEDDDATNLSGRTTYALEKTVNGTASSSSGTITVINSDETSNVSYDMTIEQSNTPVKVAAPEFLPAAGISTSDEASLFAALGDIQPEDFSRAPVTTRMMGAILLLFI